MIYFILLSIFSLFIGINNVSADGWSKVDDVFYYTFTDSSFDYDDIKEKVNNLYSLSDDNYSYNLNDYLSYGFFGLAAYNPTYKVSYIYGFNSSVSFTGLYSSFDGYANFDFSSSLNSFYASSFDFENGQNWYHDLSNKTSYYSNAVPLYLKGFITEYDVYVKFSSYLCDRYTSNAKLCSYSLRDEGDYKIIQIGWNGKELKGLLNLTNEDFILKDVSYTVNVYLDDKLKDSYSDTGKVGSKVTLKGLSDDKLKADDSNVYEVTLADGTNEFDLRYYTSTYGTVYQQINTDNSELYLPFSYDKLKSMFPGINFELWTSYEQFNFVLTFNIFFVLFLIFIGYIILKMFYFMKGWFF